MWGRVWRGVPLVGDSLQGTIGVTAHSLSVAEVKNPDYQANNRRLHAGVLFISGLSILQRRAGRTGPTVELLLAAAYRYNGRHL